MNSQPLASIVNGHRSPPPALNATILYEDFSTGLRANILFERIVRQLKLPPDSEVELLRLDLLRDSSLLAAAAQAAADSELIILSAHGRDHLPSDIEHWVKQWVGLKNDGPCAFVILLDGNQDQPPESNRVLHHLQRTASVGGVQLFHHFFNGEFYPATWDEDAADSEAKESNRLLETDWGRGWGIND